MDDYEKMSMFYRKLAEQYLSESYSLRFLEKRFRECGTPFIPQKPGQPLQFLTLMNRAHIERLDDAGMESLKNIYGKLQDEAEEKKAGKTEDIQELKKTEKFLKMTFQKVLAEDLRPGVDYEFFPDVYGRGILPGKAMVFCFQDKVEFDADGKMNAAAEGRKTRIFDNVKRQFEKMAEEKTGVMIRLVRI